MAVKIESVRLIVNGVICGETKGGDTLTTSDAVYSYGGDDWGLTLTGADVNSSSFGVVVSLSGLEATDAYSPAVSNYVKVTNFGFNIPSEYVISEITVFIEAKADAEENASIDNIKIELKIPCAISSVNSDEIVLTSPTVSLSAGAIFSVNSDEIVLTSPTVSLSAGAIFSVNSDEIVLTSPSVDFFVSKSLTALNLSFSNPTVSVDWDYLYINKSKNTTNWSDESENTTTWTNQSKASTDWKEL